MWYSGFSSPDSAAMRKRSGARSYQIFQAEDDPNHVMVLLEWDTLDNARRYFQSEKFKEAQKDSGVTVHISQQELDKLFDYGYYLKHVDDIFERVGLK